MYTEGAPFTLPLNVHFFVGKADTNWFCVVVLLRLLPPFTALVFSLYEDMDTGKHQWVQILWWGPMSLDPGLTAHYTALHCGKLPSKAGNPSYNLVDSALYTVLSYQKP